MDVEPMSKPRAARVSLRTPTLVLALIGAGCVGAAVSTWAYLRAPPPPDGGLETTLRDTPAVLTAVRELATLEAVSYHLERVIDLRDRQAHLFGLFESEDAVLLVAAVDVVAGVDLRDLREGDLRIDRAHRRAELTLPPPRILSARLDNDRTYVHTRATSMLALPGKSLETRARQEAERSLHEAALAGGILQRARLSATHTLRALIASLGFEQVEIRFRSE